LKLNKNREYNDLEAKLNEKTKEIENLKILLQEQRVLKR